jgi:hypothetical protein
MGGWVYRSAGPLSTRNNVMFQFHGDTVDWWIIGRQDFPALPEVGGPGQAVFSVGSNSDGTANAATFSAGAENPDYTIDFTLTALSCDPANRVTAADATITVAYRSGGKTVANTVKDYPLV